MKASIEQALTSAPFEFDFFHAVRMLESAHQDLPRVGRSLSPRQDPVRFGQNPSLAFAPASVESYSPADADDDLPARLQVYFLGLFGPNGPLPFHLTEFAHERLHANRDPSLTRFLDVFHHRMLSLFYRAWADSRKAVDLDRPAESRHSTYFGSFFGLGSPSMLNRDSVPDWAKLFFTGRLAAPNRNPEGLEAILREDFGVPVKLITFFGQWMTLPPDSLCSLGSSRENGLLGRTTVVGSRLWVGHFKFRLRVGPLGFVEFRRLLPDANLYKRLKDWVLNYVGREFVWDANLILKAAEVPELKLGALDGGGLLGWTTWLKSRPFQEDADDLVLIGDN
jgi:type VI secretion system protein ImpH